MFDSAKDSLTLEGQEHDPSQGVQKHDIVFRFISPAKYVSEVIFKSDPGGQHKEFKVAELTYTKSK